MPDQNVNKRRKGIETTEKILEEAARLFAKQGYDTVSTREIAAAVGIKDSSLYNHFASKAEILTALFERFAKSIPASRPTEKEVDELVELLTPDEVLKHRILRYGRSINSMINNTARIIYSEMFRNKAAAQLFRQAIWSDQTHSFANLFQKMIDKGQLKQIDVVELAELYNSSLICLTIQYAMDEPGSPEAMTTAQKMMRMAELLYSLAK